MSPGSSVFSTLCPGQSLKYPCQCTECLNSSLSYLFYARQNFNFGTRKYSILYYHVKFTTPLVKEMLLKTDSSMNFAICLLKVRTIQLNLQFTLLVIPSRLTPRKRPELHTFRRKQAMLLLQGMAGFLVNICIC